MASPKHRDISTYLFLVDPLCGWCYAAMPGITALREKVGNQQVDVAPTGLFAGKGARPMTNQFRDYAWASDQRIEAMTGQPFSQAYFDNVLSNFTVSFDSGPASLLLALVDLIKPGSGFALLSAFQQGRFVDGRDLSNQKTLVDIAAEIGIDRSELLAAFQDAEQLDKAVDRITTARRRLAQHGLEAVPTLIQIRDDEARIIPNSLLVGEPAELVAHCLPCGAA